MGNIYVIMGPSNSGKDTIFSRLKKEISELKPIVLWTTRPIRDNEINGIDYYFVDDGTLKKMEEKGEVLEKRVYETAYGLWSYFTANSSINLNENSYITVNTLEGYKSLVNYFGEYVKPIYIYVEPGERLNRALIRERMQSNPKYTELCRRFIYDEKDFSLSKLAELNINSFYENDDLDKCVLAIKNDIENDMLLKRKR